MKRAAAFALIIGLAEAMPVRAAFDIAPQGIGPGAFSTSTNPPLIASNGNGFLASWIETLPIGVSELRGSLIGPTGKSSLPFTIAPSIEFAGARLTAVGANYLLAGYDPRTLAARTATISPDGTVTRDVIRLPFSSIYRFELASIENEILFAAQSGTGEVFAHFLRSDRTLLRSETLGVPTLWAAAGAQSEYAVATVDGTAIVGYRFSSTGGLIERLVVATVTPAMRVSQLTVARGDDGFLVAWVETPPVFSSDSNVRLAAVVPNRPVALSLPATLAGARAEGLSAVWTGVDYVLVVKRAFDAQAVRIASGGPTIGSPVTITAGGAIASNRNVTYSVGQRVCCGPVIGYPLRTEATLEAGPAEVLNRGPEWQRATALASDGVDFVAVWRNATWSGSESFTRRVDRDGDPGQDGINQLPGPNATPIENGLAFAGSTYLQLYVQDTYLYAQRLSPTGEPMEPRIPIRRYAYNAAVAAAGDRFFVAWREDGGDSYSAFIAADGTMSEPRPMLSRTQPGIIHNIAFDGHGFVVLLLLPSSVIADPFGVPPDLIAVRVALDGAVLDQVPIRLLKFVERAHIASSGRDFLVVADRANDISVVRLKVIAGELQASAPSILSIPTSSAPRADVAWDGRDYAIAWRSTSRLGLVRFSGKGLASSALTIETGATANQPIAIAVNKLGDVVILLSETRDAGVAPRARTYSRGDFSAK